ncbi:copper homeostasis protein cutC homolog [Ailuropoda melanoleuca]|uniref:copper homeostasis protein cutC homolog n=1 Tax=Ailuropoda melanoleuca TaxID=9646 RepID=UPI0014944CD9|nr:copper homeostasis protein cutC homolog [Ailuropoda melanoleuca]
MKRQGASLERKRARIPSGKAGAEGGGEGAVVRPDCPGRACGSSGQWCRAFSPSTLPTSSLLPARHVLSFCLTFPDATRGYQSPTPWHRWDSAGRIELCSGLLEGGTTPSMGVLQIVKQCVQIPVFVMIRPRGGDFLYSDREVEVMKADIRLAKLYGADGLVFGALTEDGNIDKELCMSLVAICRPLPVTFHRAFDMVHDPMAALETLLTLGFERVLTSGCDSSALEGLPLIKRLIDQAKGRIVVMPGGGITDRNLQRILEGSGATEFHCSARSARDSGMKFRNFSVAMGASLSSSEYSLKVTDVAQVRTLNAIAKNILV